MANLPDTFLQLRTTIHKNGTLELSLADVPLPEPGPDQVLIRVEASPINPSDLGVLFGPADPATVRQAGTAERPVLEADVPEKLLATVAGRLGHALPAGNEGAGIVVKTGSSDAAKALAGKTVATLGGGMYAQYRVAPAAMCLVMPEGTTPKDAASCFVNPLTVLGMIETMRMEEHTALVHTAAASNLGQMLVKVCKKDDIPLVNIVRRAEHVALLKDLGATYVCDSSLPTFREDLTAALAATGATIAFDATGGGSLASQILTCMEAAASQSAKEFSRYGSTTHKQVYIYGGLDRSPTVLNRTFGMAWGVGGWLLPNFLAKVGGERAQAMRERVAAEIKTTFASHYAKEVSLAEALRLDAAAAYGRQATGEKFLVTPQKGV